MTLIAERSPISCRDFLAIWNALPIFGRRTPIWTIGLRWTTGRIGFIRSVLSCLYAIPKLA